MAVDNAEQDNRNKTDYQSAPLDTDWGKDWEAAFQSEDAMLPREDAGGKVEEFFLDESDKTVAANQAGQPPADSDKTIGIGADGAGLARPATTIGPKTSAPWSGIASRLAALSLKQKLLAALLTAGVLLLVTAGSVLFFIQPYRKPAVVKLDMPALPPIPEVVVGPAEEPGSLPKVDQPTDQHTGDTPHPPESPTQAPSATTHPAPPPPEAPPEPHKVRQKWAFPDFTIPTTIKSPDKGLSFVRLKITLIASLPPNTPLPQDKKIIVRELIYQYIKKQPPDELQRFVKTRGDLSRGLLAWLAEQWPDNPVKAVQIDSYSLS